MEKQKYITIAVKNLVGKDPNGITNVEVFAGWPSIWGEVGRSKPYFKKEEK